jgi:hypothetical protein
MYSTAKFNSPNGRLVTKAFDCPERQTFLYLSARLIYIAMIKCNGLLPDHPYEQGIEFSRYARDASEETKDTQVSDDLEEEK